MRICLVILFAFWSVIIQAQTVILPNVMPQPKSFIQGQGKFLLNSKFSISVKAPAQDTFLFAAINRMFIILARRTGLYFHQESITPSAINPSAGLIITSSQKAVADIGQDESYHINISPNHIELTAANIIGAMHGIETLLQLLDFDSEGAFFPVVTIDDAPKFAWRGLMIDVSRHFIPLDNIKRNIDAMAAVKLNVLHLHLTDAQGFRVESKVFPGLQNKGSNGKYYTQTEIRDLVRYATARGIIIVPEFDMPGHSNSWFAAYPELASAPGPYEAGQPLKFERKENEVLTVQKVMQVVQNSPFPTFDPTKESVYTFLDKFLAEMADLFPSPYIHIGGDENNGVAWKINPAIAAFMQKNKIANPHELQVYFIQRVAQLAKKHKKQVVGWEEVLTKNLSKDVVVQVWSPMGVSGIAEKSIAAGNRTIFSKNLYLDLFMPAYIHYQVELPVGIIGGEAAQWTEICDEETIEPRMWPRAAAIAEIFWSPSMENDIPAMYQRLFHVSALLDENGLQHISNYKKMIRRFARNENSTAAEKLIDVLTPIKGYKRLFAMFSLPEAASYSTAVYTRAADMAQVDPPLKWEFRAQVEKFLATKNPEAEQWLKHQLLAWRDNDQQLQSLFRSSSQAKEISAHSGNLSLLSAAALNVMDQTKSGILSDSTSTKNNFLLIQNAKTTDGEVELSVLPELEALITGKLTALPKQFPFF